jgi:hypothetical protein
MSNKRYVTAQKRHIHLTHFHVVQAHNVALHKAFGQQLHVYLDDLWELLNEVFIGANPIDPAARTEMGYQIPGAAGGIAKAFAQQGVSQLTCICAAAATV